MEQSYKMPDREADGPGARKKPRKKRTPGADSGVRAAKPALEEHYGVGPELGDALGDQQPLTPEAREHVDRMYELYDEFDGMVALDHERMRTARRIHELNDPYAGEHEPQLPVLLSTIQSKIADQLDNMPEAVLTPESPGMQEYAEDATDLVRWVFERNYFDGMYPRLAEDYYVAGCAVLQIHWDEDMDGGDGNVRLLRVPPEYLTWDPAARDLQDCRAVFKTAFHPRGWYVEHYPDAGRYVGGDSYSDPDRETNTDRDDSVMLLEAWWREYDAEQERYKVHVTHMAGRALLYDSRDDFPDGLYAHGRYPFEMCTYRDAVGTLAGRSCVEDFVELNRNANRMSKYVDWATRFAARPKLILGQDLELRDEQEITRADRQIVHVDGMVSNANLVWMPTPQIPPAAYQMMQWSVDALKQESGQNQFARGEGGMGVTAASAIQSLQEAGAKSSRMESQRLADMYRRAVEQVLWLMGQFYELPRIIMITGKQDSPYAADILLAGRQMLTESTDMHPAYRVNTQIRRRNPLRIESENQLILQLYEMSLRGNAPMDVLNVLELLQVDGKERILPRMQEAQQQQAQTAQALQLAQAATAEAQQSREQMTGMREQMMAQAQEAINTDPTSSVYG